MGAVSPPHTTQLPFKDYILCFLAELRLQEHLLEIQDLALPIGSTTVLYSDGTNITGKLQTKGYYTPLTVVYVADGV